MAKDTDIIDDNRCRLYLLTPPAIEDIGAFADRLDRTLAAGEGQIGAVQLRLKEAPSLTVIRDAAHRLLPVCHAHGVAFLINDHVDIAAETGADGVHLGQDDLPLKDARKLLGQDAIIGISCHDSQHLAMQAGEQGADYIAFGAFYPTTTKQAQGRPTPDLLRWWNEWTVLPSVAIGGITPDNAAPLVQAGAHFLAVLSGLWHHPQGPETAVAEFLPVLRAK